MIMTLVLIEWDWLVAGSDSFKLLIFKALNRQLEQVLEKIFSQLTDYISLWLCKINKEIMELRLCVCSTWFSNRP